jgi:hypothetical protein
LYSVANPVSVSPQRAASDARFDPADGETIAQVLKLGKR